MGRVTVYDVHGSKVHELSGMLTYEKYVGIEERSDPNITEFEGVEDYRRIAGELKTTMTIEVPVGLGKPFSGSNVAPTVMTHPPPVNNPISNIANLIAAQNAKNQAQQDPNNITNGVVSLRPEISAIEKLINQFKKPFL